MSRLKVKCASCGKVFTPSNTKQTLCPDCEKAQRAARAHKRTETTTPAQTQQPSAPLIQGPGASVLRPGAIQVALPATAPVPERARTAVAPASGQFQQSGAQAKSRTAPSSKAGHNGAQGHSKAKAPRAATPPFTLTEDMSQQIEERYLALANPIEYDGIRTQIAAELGVPKTAVRAVVRDLRMRRGMPSWWELQGFAGSQNDLERIKAAYTPHLPLPQVGVHREIAESLGMEPRMVYRGIRKIRAQMGLPQYNAPDERVEGDTLPATSDAGEGAEQPAS